MMMIRRATFDRYRAHHPGIGYGPKDDGADGENSSARVHAFFQTAIDSKHMHLASEIGDFLSRQPDATHDDIRAFLTSDEAIGDYSGRHVSEDYAFCRGVREAGMRVWLCPWMILTHTGAYRFESRLAEMGTVRGG
jgi:GT2 family glycosyltransferase